MEDYERYKRQLPIDGWGEETQRKLADSRVCIVGAGGLGSPVSLYLAAAGVGALVLCDYQEVELSNLNRQILYSTSDIGFTKVERAKERLEELNPSITVEIRSERLTESTAPEIFGSADLIIDCLDNFESRYTLNRYAVEEGVAFIHAGITELHGQLILLSTPDTPCLECIMPPSSVGDRIRPPVLGATAGVVGSLQAVTALKALGGDEKAGYGVLRTVDLRNMTIDSIALEKNPACEVCGSDVE